MALGLKAAARLTVQCLLYQGSVEIAHVALVQDEGITGIEAAIHLDYQVAAVGAGGGTGA